VSFVRRYSFHLVLAGHRFIKCGYRQHGVRNYLLALKTFSQLNWGAIKDHIHFTLGRQAFHTGAMRESLEYFIELMSNTRQNVNQQNFYLREFLYVYNVFPFFL
jgi:hypothetical protein